MTVRQVAALPHPCDLRMHLSHASPKKFLPPESACAASSYPLAYTLIVQAWLTRHLVLNEEDSP